MEENKKTVPSFDQVAKAQLFEGKLMSREDLRDMFVRDLKRCHVFMTEVIQCPPAVDALTDVYYERYKRMHEAMAKQPELPLDEGKAFVEGFRAQYGPQSNGDGV